LPAIDGIIVQRMILPERDDQTATTGGDYGDDLRLTAALRAGDEAAFVWCIDRYHTSLVRLAAVYVRSPAVAEEVAQETWLAVLQGIGRFEARSSFKTWLFRILTNRAKTRGEREARTVTFSALAGDDPDGPAVDPERFFPPGHRLAGHWSSPPHDWEGKPEERLLSGETLDRVHEAVASLPPSQREVITMRDIEGWSAEEVCNALSITETNQRVLLHRARSKVQQALERYVNED
jgi:RNA polymerase sigma-70 factor (ECF subfamily)